MARTVIGYFRNLEQATKTTRKLVEQGYDPTTIQVAYDEKPGTNSEAEFDNTIESAPMIAFKQAFFGADFTEEDANYYNKLLNEGDVFVAVYVPSNDSEDRDWETRTAKTIENIVAKGGAFDHEIRKIYSNRAGLTTYPQNRYLDPVGPNKLNQDRIYDSRSPLNGEVSNVIGVQENVDYFEEVSKMGGRLILTATEFLARQGTR